MVFKGFIIVFSFTFPLLGAQSSSQMKSIISSLKSQTSEPDTTIPPCVERGYSYMDRKRTNVLNSTRLWSVSIYECSGK